MRISHLVSALAACACVAQAAAADLPSIQNVRLHDFDSAIMRVLGFSDASVLYFREMGTISQDEVNERGKYESISCDPFYVMKDGKVDNKGYNCRTFFCVGYMNGPQQCRNTKDEPYGGVVEINNRLTLTPAPDTKKYFTSYAAGDQNAHMHELVAQLEPIKCKPFYLLEYDLIVGEGYSCDELGKYPNYSAKNECTNDWRTTKGMTCLVPLRDNEYQIRLGIAGGSNGTSSTYVMSRTRVEVHASTGATVHTHVSTGSSVNIQTNVNGSSSSSSVKIRTFPDVLQGKYGYTAITTLASLGVINGYADGTFRPNQTINRAEFLRLLMSGLHENDVRDENGCFSDVRQAWYSSSVCAAKRLGWINGYMDGTFRAGQTITKAEAIKIIVASLNQPLASTAQLPPGVSATEWYSPYVRKAVEMNLLLEGQFEANATATRADTAVWMYRAAKFMVTAMAQ